MRYFLDTEFNGLGGELMSLALVPEHGDQEFYIVLPLPSPLQPIGHRTVSSVGPGIACPRQREL